MMMGITMTAGAVIIAIFAGMNSIGLVPDNLRTDPIYGVNIIGDSPQIVNQVKVGDDIMPRLYQTWYNPKTREYSDFIVEVGG